MGSVPMILVELCPDQTSWFIKETEANYHSSLMKETSRYSVMIVMIPSEYVTALRSQFLSEHSSACTKKSDFYCNGKKKTQMCSHTLQTFHILYLYFLEGGDSTLSI